VFDRSFWSGDSPDIGVGVYMGCPGVQGVQERVDNKSSAGGGGGAGMGLRVELLEGIYSQLCKRCLEEGQNPEIPWPDCIQGSID